MEENLINTNVISKNDNNLMNSKSNYTSALTVLTSLFFMWGFITVLNDILIPHLKAAFSLNYTEVMLIQFCFFGAYFIMSIPAAYIIKKIGYKGGIIVGLIITGIGCIAFYPAAIYRFYPFFLAALFILASGITVLQVSANPYVAILGKPETASSRLNLSQAFNSLGTTLAPFFGSLLILSFVAKTADELAKMLPAELEAYKIAQASVVKVPYLGIAAVLFILAALIAFFKLPKIDSRSIEEKQVDEGSALPVGKSIWSYPHLVFGAIAIFVYVGAEVSIGSFLVNFLGEPDIAGLPEVQAGKFVSFYWGGAMIGRFIGSGLLRKIKSGKLLAFNSVFAALLILIAIFFSGNIAMWSVLSIGLFNSIMFPNIFTMAIEGLGRFTSQGSGILIMAIVGGAILPVIQGILADNIGILYAYFLPFICYIYISSGTG